MTTLALRMGVVPAIMAAAYAAETLGCETLVRDAAFRAPRDVHRLCVMATSDDAEAKATVERLTRWLDEEGRGLNLEIVTVNADDPDLQWTNYGIPSAPPRLPVVVLVGRDRGAGRSFVIDHWEPEPAPDELEVLASSPARESLQKQLGTNLAVLVHVPKSGSDGQEVASRLARAADRWSERTPLGLPVVRLDRTDPAERVLLSFLGVRPYGPDWVGVVFGRGKLMAPPLEGEEIDAARLDELLDQLVLACSCSKPMESMGVDLPIHWDDRLDATFIPISDPEAEPEESYVELALPALNEDAPSRPEAGQNASGEPDGDAAPESDGEPGQPRLTAASSADAPAPVRPADRQKPPARSGSLLTIAVGTVSVLVLAVVVLSAVMLAGKGAPPTRSESRSDS